jgi:hypothetical protein
MAAGDRLLDASGNVILDSSGNIMLDDGAGNTCCCGGSSSPCQNCTGTVADTLTVVLSGITVNTACTANSAAPTYRFRYTTTTLSGTFSVVRQADSGTTCTWAYDELVGTSVVGAQYNLTGSCVNKLQDFGFSIRVNRFSDGTMGVSAYGHNQTTQSSFDLRLFVAFPTPSSGCVNASASNVLTTFGTDAVIGTGGTASVTQ